VWWVWIFGDLVAFAVILGFPLTAGLVARLATVVRERAGGRSSRHAGQPARRRLLGPHPGRGRADVAVPGPVRGGGGRAPAAALAGPGCRWWPACLLGQALAIQVLFYTRW
jgi:hypothetical protein